MFMALESPLPFPPSAPSPWKDMEILCWEILLPEDKRDISETQHAGEVEVFRSILGKADGNLKEVFLYVLRCPNAGLMGRKAAGGKAASDRSSPAREAVEAGSDLIFN